MNGNNHREKFLPKDISIIVFSVIVAIVLVETGLLGNLISSTKELKLVGSFIAGMFFTSVFTTAPAIVALGQIALSNSLFLTALFGAFGAVLGDLIIFRFIRDRFSEHLFYLVEKGETGKKIKLLLKIKYFRWLTFLAGGLIIASPLPDELGVSLLGFSKMKVSWFISIAFVFNFIGIVLIGLVARAL